jgi:large subunit ribosomal protein L3
MSLGIIGQKAGMTRVFDSSGVSVPVTAINVSPNTITQIKTLEKDGYQAIQVSFGQKKESRTNKAVLGHYKKASATPGKVLTEFRLNDKEIEGLEIGKPINLNLFKEGEHVDITGTTIGKGFQGGVKRHHFTMQDATHGNSLSHRALGSTGQCQDPGRVFKGKKMAGQLGNVKNTIQNLVIVKIFTEDNIILVKGSIPGHDGSNVIIKHTQKKYTLKEILTKDGELQEETKEVKKSAKKEAKEAKEEAKEVKEVKEVKEEVKEPTETKQTTEKNLPDSEKKDKE